MELASEPLVLTDYARFAACRIEGSERHRQQIIKFGRDLWDAPIGTYEDIGDILENKITKLVIPPVFFKKT